MIDVDFGPGVFVFYVIVVFTFPAIYGWKFVDAYWRKHRDAAAAADSDAFN